MAGAACGRANLVPLLAGPGGWRRPTAHPHRACNPLTVGEQSQSSPISSLREGGLPDRLGRGSYSLHHSCLRRLWGTGPQGCGRYCLPNRFVPPVQLQLQALRHNPLPPAGEMSHHDVLAATARGVVVILCEHSNTERGFLQSYMSLLQASLGPAVAVTLSERDADPLTVV